MHTQLSEVYLHDSANECDVLAIQVTNDHGLEIVIIPDRAMDIYSLHYYGVPISYTNRNAAISPVGFQENGTLGFGRQFFAGFCTTCGLIQSGRPCEENHRAFGLHGCVSNTSANTIETRQYEDCTEITAIIREQHEQGENMQLRRTLRISDGSAAFAIHDEVTNLSKVITPFMMMYHINFGAPFLSEQLQMRASFTSIEDRDSPQPVPEGQLLRMGAEGSAQREEVYYTRPDLQAGVVLYQPELGIRLDLNPTGDGLAWMGIWKNFIKDRYALGIEPCNCPGLGRVNARKRGLLPRLFPQETRSNTIRVKLVDCETGQASD